MELSAGILLQPCACAVENALVQEPVFAAASVIVSPVFQLKGCFFGKNLFCKAVSMPIC